MKQQVTTGIVIRRVAYGEADRIITLITPDAGKLALMAKGVRRVKSKLAGGIELFSTSEITYIQGRGSVGTLVSSRLQRHYAAITKDINRTMLGYELIKQLDTITEDETEQEYFDLLNTAFAVLEDESISSDLISAWFGAQLLRLAGHMPNLVTTQVGEKLSADKTYEFDYDATAFHPRDGAAFGVNEIKFLRLIFSGNHPQVLTKVERADELTAATKPLVQTLRQLHLRI